MCVCSIFIYILGAVRLQMHDEHPAAAHSQQHIIKIK